MTQLLAVCTVAAASSEGDSFSVLVAGHKPFIDNCQYGTI